MNEKYVAQDIEKKWQQYWEDNHTFKTEYDESKEKYYVLEMFPYPSGSSSLQENEGLQRVASNGLGLLWYACRKRGD